MTRALPPFVVQGAGGSTTVRRSSAQPPLVLQVKEVAAATGRRESTIRSRVKHRFAKHGLSRQAGLIRLVRSFADVPEPVC